MKPATLLIFSLIFISTHGQVADNFSDGDFTNNPTWLGSISNFTVNSDLQLQLNSPAAGQSFLSLPVNMNIQTSVEWEFYIRLDFSPSSSNYSRIYLSSDQSDLSQPLNGYFIQFGESLSNDAIELFRQDGNTVTSVCRAADGKIASAFELKLKIIRDSVATWKIFVDYDGGTNYNLEASGTDSSYVNSPFAGISCLYSLGNVDRFYFDDFYFGPEIPDTVPPDVSAIEVVTDSTLLILFSEAIDVNTLYVLGNYEIDSGIGHPFSIIRDSIQPLKCKLTFANRFNGGVQYHLSIDALKDLSNNEIITHPMEFIYTPIAIAGFNDIVFTEVYFAPSVTSPLPYAEYIEIYNRKDSAVNIAGWTISDGTSDGEIVSFILPPHQYALLFDEDDASLFSSFPNAYSVESFPSLNNDGDFIRLFDSQATLISELQFDVSSYKDNSKDDGGWSIERMDVGFVCVNSGNWRASASSFHGTPSSTNSIEGTFTDNASPFITNAFLSDSMTLVILFSEPVSDDASDLNNYKITDENRIQESTLQSVYYSGDSSIIKFSSSLPDKIFTLQVSENIHDCPGNNFQTFHTIRFGYAEPASVNDIIINELLYYCFDGSNDFVEIYNNSSKVIDVKDWSISESEYSDLTDERESAKITSTHRLCFPGEYLVLSADDKKVKSFYTCNNPYAFQNVHSMPDYSSIDGSVVIKDNLGNYITSFSYNDDMHFPLLKDARGVSLERLTFSNNDNNWHSAAGTVGYATPGYLNSQSVGYALGGDGFSVNVEIFSPDGDGYCDVLAIHYRSEQAGTVLSLNAFDFSGQQVRTILDHETISSEGFAFWDGLSNSGEQLPAGVYIILGSSYTISEGEHSFKRAVYLTRNTY